MEGALTDMICANCGQTGIRWMGPFNNLTHTECPHCGGRNCQQVEADDDGHDDDGHDDGHGGGLLMLSTLTTIRL